MTDHETLIDKPLSTPDMPAEDWYGPDAATFGDRMAAAREQAGLTQAQLARRLGIKASTLRNWEQDLSEPRANRLSMIAGILNVSMMWLLNGEGEGLDAPVGAEIVLDSDVADLLRDLRDLRVEMHDNADRLARLEKRLRAAIKASA